MVLGIQLLLLYQVALDVSELSLQPALILKERFNGRPTGRATGNRGKGLS